MLVTATTKLQWVALSMSSSGGLRLWQLTMAGLITDNYILFNYMGTYYSCMMAHGYFAGPDYLAVKVWVRTTVLFTSFLKLTGTNVCMNVKVFPWIVGLGSRNTPLMYCGYGWCDTFFSYDCIHFFVIQNNYFITIVQVSGIYVASVIST